MTPLRAAPEIALTNLTVAYDGHPAVHHLSGAFASGSLTAIVGPNGAGKSTLLSALSGQLKGIEGSIRFGDAARMDLAYLPQQSAIDREFPVRVLDVVVHAAKSTSERLPPMPLVRGRKPGMGFVGSVLPGRVACAGAFTTAAGSPAELA